MGINRDTPESNELNEEVLRRLLKRHRQNLNYYREQAALYGPSPPLELHNRISETEAEIERIVSELEDMT